MDTQLIIYAVARSAGGEAAVETIQDDVTVSCTACGIAVSGFKIKP